MKQRDKLSLILRTLVWAAAIATMAIVGLMIGYILIKGIPALTPELFAWEYT